ncbi:Glutamyl-tRNA(Gln) amidotransferase subunit C [Nymphaea thermarum]|nr:Glutamyl-tRNA(Gln) amidotransferase subunit C [Nymphaea thermarum]
MFASASVPPPDVAKLAESARIVLTSDEAMPLLLTFFDSSAFHSCTLLLSLIVTHSNVNKQQGREFKQSNEWRNRALVEEFTPKIRQVVDWFGQLQAVDLESVEPALRADMDVYDNLRPDAPEIFENRESMLSSVPSYDEPYIKVPKVLNKERSWLSAPSSNLHVPVMPQYEIEGGSNDIWKLHLCVCINRRDSKQTGAGEELATSPSSPESYQILIFVFLVAQLSGKGDELTGYPATSQGAAFPAIFLVTGGRSKIFQMPLFAVKQVEEFA